MDDASPPSPDAAPAAPPPVVLTIAGSDSGGGAGVQADLKTFAAMGCHGCSALTAITAQNTRTVRAAELLRPELVSEQIDAVAEDLPPAALKTGMIGATPAIDAIADAIRRHRLSPLVVDPVMVTKNGAPLIDETAVRRLASEILPLASVTTPNRHEAASLLRWDHPPDTVDAAADAAREICDRFGPAACVVKGLHRENSHGHPERVDVCHRQDHTGQPTYETHAPHHPDGATHGSGCVHSAALACALAKKQPLTDALDTAKRIVTAAIAQGVSLGAGTGPVNPNHNHPH